MGFAINLNLLSLLGFALLSTLVIAISGNDNSLTNNSPFPPLTDKEITAIKQLRESVGPYLYQNYMRRDQYLLRWITDANFDLEAARAKLLKAIEWRKTNNIDTILQEDFSQFQRTCPYTINGQDKDGRPLLTLGVGKCDLRKMVIAGDINKFERFMKYLLETCAETVRQIVKSGKDVRDGTVIIDLNGFNLRQHGCLRCLPAVFTALTYYEAYYPEYLHRVYFVNVPRIATSFMDIVISTLSPKTKSILRVYNYDRQEWEKEIRKEIDPDQLTFQFGGNKNSQSIANL